MKFSSSFKVGLLTFLALTLFLCVVIKVKGRTFSNAERITIQFKDVNGMRPGAAVQMMGMRVGQVEEVKPVISENENYVNVKFVITNSNIDIPKASVFSIQQSGLIGELFLEITPPKLRTTYLPMETKDILYKDDVVKMQLDDEIYDVGKIKNIEVVSGAIVPYSLREIVKTNYAYKVDYVTNLPGLILPEFMKGELLVDKKEGNAMLISTLDDVVLPYPHQESPYTIVEPMRISDFLEWQLRAAEGLTETNKKVNQLLSEEMIVQLQESIGNMNNITADASSVLNKINNFMDDDLENFIQVIDRAASDFHKLSDSINKILEDPQTNKTLTETAEAFNSLSKNINTVFGDDATSQQVACDIRSIIKNVNEISVFANSMAKDDKLKASVTTSIRNLNEALLDISTALAPLNALNSENKTEVQTIVDDISVSTSNLRKFSEKLNKRFLLFRLLF